MKKHSALICIMLVFLAMACAKKPVGELKIIDSILHIDLVDSNGTVFYSSVNGKILKINKYFFVEKLVNKDKKKEEYKIFSSSNAKLTYDTYERVFNIRFIDSIIFAKQGDSLYMFDRYLNRIGLFRADWALPFNSKFAILGRKIDEDHFTRFLVNTKGQASFNQGYMDIISFSFESFILRAAITLGRNTYEKDLDNDEYKNVLNDSICVVLQNNKYGLTKTNGEQILPNKFSFLWVYQNDILIAYENAGWSLLRDDGEYLTKEFYEAIGDYSIYFTTDDNQSIDTIKFYNHINSSLNLSYCINYSKKEKLDCLLRYKNWKGLSEGLIRVKKDGKWGYIDTLGREVIPLKYSSAKNFNRGVAEVELKGKKLKIYKDGTVVK